MEPLTIAEPTPSTATGTMTKTTREVALVTAGGLILPLQTAQDRQKDSETWANKL
jgi:hypothetical protein